LGSRVALARAQGLRVLSARPTDAEAQFSFGALVDLLDEVDTNALKKLPAQQRHVLVTDFHTFAGVDPASRGQ
jgi:hypothetical protein